jgi:DNA-binding CsgD family transcriptional regulator
MQPCDRLTAKETQVAMLVWEGQTNREIANVVGTTEQVVKNYLRNTFDKLGVWSRLELALYVAAHGGAHWRDRVEMPTAAPPLTGEISRLPRLGADSVRVRADDDDQRSPQLPHKSKVSSGLISA